MLTIRIDAREPIKKILKLKGGLNNLSPVFSAIEKEMMGNVNNNFGTEGAFLEKKWANLKPSTIAQRLRSGFSAGPILQRTGKLKNSTYRKEKTNTRVVVGNRASYYPYHQLGTSKMPQRQIMRWTNTTKEKILKMFKIYVDKLLK